MKRILSFFLVTCVFAITSVGFVQAADHPITNISVISAPFGTGSYVISTALEDISKKFHIEASFFGGSGWNQQNQQFIG